jgi:hypothetical protein
MTRFVQNLFASLRTSSNLRRSQLVPAPLFSIWGGKDVATRLPAFLYLKA